MLVGEQAVVAQQVLDGPVGALAEGPGGGVRRRFSRFADTLTGEGASAVAAVVQADADLIGEAFDPREVEFEETVVIGTDRVGLAVVDTGGGQLLDPVAVHDVPVGVDRHVDAVLQGTVLVVRVDERGELEVQADLVTGIGAVLGPGGEPDLEVSADLLVDAAVQRDAAVRLRGHGRVILEIRSAEAVAAAFGAAGDAHLVVLGVTVLEHHVLPVRDRIVRFVEGIRILPGHLTETDVFRAGHHRILDRSLQGRIGVEGHHRGLADRSLIGTDQDDTIGAAGTVDGRGRGILENVDALDVVGGDFRQASHERNAVQHDERVVRCGERTLAADTDGGGLARLGRGGLHIHAGDTAHQGIGHVIGRNLAQVVAAHGHDGTGHILAAGRTVTDDDRGFELLGIIFEDDVDPAAALDGNADGGVAHAGDLENCGGSRLEGIRTIDARDGAVGRIHDHHGRARDRRTALVRDRTADANALRQGEEREHQAGCHECKRFL